MKNQSTKRLLFIAYLWNMFGKLIVRSLGVISTLILVRLLEPSDFGLVAVGMMIIGFFKVLSNAGINRYLILLDCPDNNDYDAAWTLNIILRTLLLSLLALLANLLSQFFESPPLEEIIYVMCATQFFGSFRNVGMVKLERQLNYGKENKVLVTAKLVSFSVGLAAAFYFKNYYALLIGNIVNVIVDLVCSYIVINYRPKFNFNFSPEMFSYSKFLLIRNIVSYSRSQMDILLVGQHFGNAATGQFNVARQFSIMPQAEIIGPVMQPVFAGLSRFKSEPKKLMLNSIQVLQICYLALVPCAFGMLAVAEPFTALVLGEKWLAVKDFIGMLSFLMIVFVTQPILNNLYDANGKVKYSMYADIVGIIGLLTGTSLFIIEDLETFSAIRVCIGFLTFLSLVGFARLHLKFPIKKLLQILGLPIFCSLLMLLVLLAFEDKLAGISNVVTLLSLITLGTLSYLFILVFCSFIIIKITKESEVAILVNSIPKTIISSLKLNFLVQKKC